MAAAELSAPSMPSVQQPPPNHAHSAALKDGASVPSNLNLLPQAAEPSEWAGPGKRSRPHERSLPNGRRSLSASQAVRSSMDFLEDARRRAPRAAPQPWAPLVPQGPAAAQWGTHQRPSLPVSQQAFGQDRDRGAAAWPRAPHPGCDSPAPLQQGAPSSTALLPAHGGSAQGSRHTSVQGSNTQLRGSSGTGSATAADARPAPAPRGPAAAVSRYAGSGGGIVQQPTVFADAPAPRPAAMLPHSSSGSHSLGFGSNRSAFRPVMPSDRLASVTVRRLPAL